MTDTTSGDQPIEVRDLREKGFFMVDDWFLDKYASALGPHASVVYCALCRHADKKQTAWPSVATLAKKIGVARSTVLRALTLLESAHMIAVGRRVGRRNHYFLTDRSTWPDPAHIGAIDAEPVSRSYQSHSDTSLTVIPDQSHSDTRPVSHSYQSHIIVFKRNTRRTHKKDTHTVCTGFEQFWKAYPKKRSKGRAEKAWLNIQPDEQLVARIIATIGRAKTSAEWQRDGGRYIPHPATWLNAQGWEDVMQPELTPSGTHRADETRQVRVQMKGGVMPLDEALAAPAREAICTTTNTP